MQKFRYLPYHKPNLDPLDVEDVYLLASFTRSLRLHLSGQRAPSVAKLRVPQEFVKAWLHCVSFFISLGTRYSNGLHRHHHEKCLKAFEDGRLDLVRLFCRTKLAKTEAAPAIVIATKLCHRLLQDMTDNHSDLISSYWTYVGQLVSHRILSQFPDRMHPFPNQSGKFSPMGLSTA